MLAAAKRCLPFQFLSLPFLILLHFQLKRGLGLHLLFIVREKLLSRIVCYATVN